jgi:hypothetical protein
MIDFNIIFELLPIEKILAGVATGLVLAHSWDW